MSMLFRTKRFLPHSPQSMFHSGIKLFVLYFMIVIPAYIAAQSPAPSRPAPKVFTEYDRFTDETTVGISITLEKYQVEIPTARMQEFLMLLGGFTHSGKQMEKQPATVRLAFQSQARNWRFREGAQLDAIVDGERIAFGSLDYSRKNLGAGHLEILRLDAPVRTFLKLARGKSVEIRIGSKEVKLSEEHRAGLAALAEQMTGSSKQ